MENAGGPRFSAPMNVVLVEPEIPPNTGNIGRLCAATGATLHLVGPLGFRLDDRELKRAGMDYWRHIVWKTWDSFDALRAQAAPDARFHLVETKSPRLYTEPRYRWGDYLVFGRETKGLPGELLAQHEGSTISIPMFHEEARSLNLATAVAIVLFHSIWEASGHTWQLPSGKQPV
jgi:tRNA (cytidine/uridine-2'-O-)-methyltransferase